MHNTFGDTAIENKDNNGQMKAGVFIDFSNFHYYLKKNGWEIDWKKFKAFLSNLYSVSAIYYYEGTLSKAAFFDIFPENTLTDFIFMKEAKERYLKFLRNNGFIVRQKLINRVFDSKEEKYKHKCNFDVELTIDAIDTIDSYDVFILCSGDGDFQKLIKYIKGKYKKTIIIAGKERLSKYLKKASNQVIFLKDIKCKICKIGSPAVAGLISPRNSRI